MSPETFNSNRQGPTVLSPWTLACCFVVCKYSVPGGVGNPVTSPVQDPSMGSVLPLSAVLPSSKWYPWKDACSVRSILLLVYLGARYPGSKVPCGPPG